MGNPRFVALPLLAVAAVLAIVSLFTPWWTLKIGEGDASESWSARPFDGAEIEGADVDLVGSGQVLTAGLLLIAAAVAAGVGAGIVVIPSRTSRTPQVVGGLLGLAGAALMVTAVVLALVTWPGSGLFEDTDDKPSFWDSNDDFDAKTYASVGWYLAAGAVIVAGLGGGVAFTNPGPRTYAAPTTSGATMSQWYGQQRPATAYAPPYQPAAAPPPPTQWAPAYPASSTPAAPPQYGTGQWEAVSPAPAAPAAPPPPRAAPPAPPPPPPPAAPAASVGVKILQCPRCGTRVQAPPIRPVDLVCPNCRFVARLER